MPVKWKFRQSDRSYHLKVVVKEVCDAWRQGRRYTHEQVARMLYKAYRSDQNRNRVEARKYRKLPAREGWRYGDCIRPRCEGCVWLTDYQKPCKAGNWLLMDGEGHCLGKRVKSGV